jgi:hypothetical protein
MLVAGVQRLEHILQARRIADRQHAAVRTGMQGFARPIAHRPARAFDHRHQRGKIVQLEVRLAHHVEMA